MAYIYDLADVWSASGTVFTGIKLNVVDTASAAGSLLMDLQVGGASKFSVGKTGSITVSGTSGYANSGILFAGAGPKLYANSNIFAVNNASYGMFGCDFGATQARINGGVAFGFSSGDVTTSLDVILARDAANTLAQRNGVNAQAFNLYNTYTDASNYERVRTGWSGNVFAILPQAAGTGSLRTMRLGGTVEIGISGSFSPDATGVMGIAASNGLRIYSPALEFPNNNLIAWSSTSQPWGTKDLGVSRPAAGVLRINNGSTGGGSLEMQEVTAPAAPATNNVRIYAEDNGSGKTRLMAVFATGAAQQIAIEP